MLLGGTLRYLDLPRRPEAEPGSDPPTPGRGPFGTRRGWGEEIRLDRGRKNGKVVSSGDSK